MKLGFEEDADGNRQRVGVTQFDFDEVARSLGDPVMDESDVKREAGRAAILAVLDTLIPNGTKAGNHAVALLAIGRNAVLLAYACGHGSVGQKKMSELCNVLGVNQRRANWYLQRVKRRAGML